MPPAVKHTPAKKATSPAVRHGDDEDDDKKATSHTVQHHDDDNDVTSDSADSAEQAELVAAGARPTHVDVDSLHAQIQRMQAQLDQMNAQAVDTSDPVGAAKVNLAAHIQAQCDANPVLAERAVELRTRVNEMRENDSLSADDVAELRLYVDEFAEDNPQTDLSYVRRLARDLHKEVMGKDKGHKKTDKK